MKKIKQLKNWIIKNKLTLKIFFKLKAKEILIPIGCMIVLYFTGMIMDYTYLSFNYSCCYETLPNHYFGNGKYENINNTLMNYNSLKEYCNHHPIQTFVLREIEAILLYGILFLIGYLFYSWIKLNWKLAKKKSKGIK